MCNPLDVLIDMLKEKTFKQTTKILKELQYLTGTWCCQRVISLN